MGYLDVWSNTFHADNRSRNSVSNNQHRSLTKVKHLQLISSFVGNVQAMTGSLLHLIVTGHFRHLFAPDWTEKAEWKARFSHGRNNAGQAYWNNVPPWPSWRHQLPGRTFCGKLTRIIEGKGVEQDNWLSSRVCVCVCGWVSVCLGVGGFV